jgi:hypothetical protein
MSQLIGIKKITLIIVSTIVLLGIFVVVSVRYMIGDTTERRTLWHDKSRALIADTSPGLSREQVAKIAKEHGFSENQIYRLGSEIYVHTPGEFGATNWVIRFGFSDNRLTYIKVRTDDNIDPEHKPKDAPEDIFYSPNINE